MPTPEPDRLRAEYVSAFRSLEEVPALEVDRCWREIEQRVAHRRTVGRALAIVAAIAAAAAFAVGWSMRPPPVVDPLVALRPAVSSWRSPSARLPVHNAPPAGGHGASAVEVLPSVPGEVEPVPETSPPGSVRSHRFGVASRRHEAALESRAERRERPSTLAEETRAYRAIRQALRDGHVSLALALLDAYEHRFPAGVYRDESELARVRALCVSNRAAQARAVLERPRNEHLESELRAVLKSTCREEGGRR